MAMKKSAGMGGRQKGGYKPAMGQKIKGFSAKVGKRRGSFGKDTASPAK